MSTTDYVIDLALIALVVLQVRDRRTDARSLLMPVVLVAIACALYLKAVPTGGNDLLLYLVLGGTGAILGVATALATRVWRAPDGYAHSKAGVLAAALWVVGVGSRFAYQEYATRGGGAAIARFSVHHHITSTQAWVTAVLFMALAEVVFRLIVLRAKGSSARSAGSDTSTSLIVP